MATFPFDAKVVLGLNGQSNIGMIFDVLQDIREAFAGFVQRYVNPAVSDQLGLSRSEYLKAIEGGVPSHDSNNLPEYAGHPFDIVNGNEPAFGKDELSVELGFERYADLDELGRCGVAFALVSKETMPGEADRRKTIKHITPSGWRDTEYDFIEGGKLFHRCHLIGYRLTAEQGNPQNLFTGTRYLNHAMRVFENMVSSHCEEHKDARVLYRAIPAFRDGETVARGVQLEVLSICEADAPLKFNVYLHNVQPGVSIDYATGTSHRDGSVSDSMLRDCMVNEKTKVFHRRGCPTARSLKGSDCRTFTGMRDELVSMGYAPCKKCNP